MKKTLLIVLLLLVVGVLSAAAYLRFALPDVGPAKTLKAPTDAASVARGEYLANHVMVCKDCHSTRDWSPFSAPLATGPPGAGGEYFGPEFGFPGKFYSSNLTPANLGNWTDGEIFRAITCGVSKDGSALFPIMPYAYYGQLDPKDVLDIIAYIRTLPAVPDNLPPSEPDFPMSLILNTIPKDASPGKRPAPSDTLAYDAYLVKAAACIECHAPAEKGQIIQERAFHGGREFHLPGGVLYSANLTPDKATGIGNWSREDFLTHFKNYRDPAAPPIVPKDGYNTIMPWTMYAHMTDADLAAIYTYLRNLPPATNKVAIFTARK